MFGPSHKDLENMVNRFAKNGQYMTKTITSDAPITEQKIIINQKGFGCERTLLIVKIALDIVLMGLLFANLVA